MAVDDMWEHDMYGGGGRGGGGARNSGAVNVVGKALADAGGKLLINNLHTSVTQQDVKARDVFACACDDAARARRRSGGCGKGGRCGRGAGGKAMHAACGAALPWRRAAPPVRTPPRACPPAARTRARSRAHAPALLCARVFPNARNPGTFHVL
jgi:hypothetical protein